MNHAPCFKTGARCSYSDGCLPAGCRCAPAPIESLAERRNAYEALMNDFVAVVAERDQLRAALSAVHAALRLMLETFPVPIRTCAEDIWHQERAIQAARDALAEVKS